MPYLPDPVVEYTFACLSAWTDFKFRLSDDGDTMEVFERDTSEEEWLASDHPLNTAVAWILFHYSSSYPWTQAQLWRAGQTIAVCHKGVIPHTLDELLYLSGITKGWGEIMEGWDVVEQRAKTKHSKVSPLAEGAD